MAGVFQGTASYDKEKHEIIKMLGWNVREEMHNSGINVVQIMYVNESIMQGASEECDCCCCQYCRCCRFCGTIEFPWVIISA